MGEGERVLGEVVVLVLGGGPVGLAELLVGEGPADPGDVGEDAVTQWQSQRRELLAAHTAATAELEKSRAPLKEFQAVYNAVRFRRVAHKPGMAWDQLADARLVASSAPQCDAAKAPTADGAPAAPFMTIYRPVGGEQWERRKDLGASCRSCPMPTRSC